MWSMRGLAHLPGERASLAFEEGAALLQAGEVSVGHISCCAMAAKGVELPGSCETDLQRMLVAHARH